MCSDQSIAMSNDGSGDDDDGEAPAPTKRKGRPTQTRVTDFKLRKVDESDFSTSRKS